MTDVVIILTTAPEDRAESIARALVDEKLAACANVCTPMTSFYRWRGAVERDTERQLVIKTTREQVEAVRVRLGELHSYELPEFLVVGVDDGSGAYIDWVKDSVR